MNAENIAMALGRYTRKTGGGFMSCCPAHNDKNPSLSIDQGEDGKLLFNCLAGCSQSAVIESLKALDLWPGISPYPLPPKANTSQIWEPITPVPLDAPTPPDKHFKYGTPSMEWRYKDKSGNLLQIVLRFDTGDKKQILPLTWCTNGNKKEWRWQGLPEPRPLYGLELIAKRKHIVFSEGEKSADAGRRLLGPKIPVLTWPNGAKAVGKTDFSPIAGKNIAIWPDADPPGYKAAIDVAEACLNAGAESVKIVRPPEGKPPGWDLADAEEDGWTSALVIERLREGLSINDFKNAYFPADTATKEKTVFLESQEAEPPLLFGEIDTPDIPTSLLPGWLGEYANAVAKYTQTPKAMAAMLGISAVATCTAKRYEVAPYGEGYSEPLNLWTATALPPANRKTAVISAMTSPHSDWEKERGEELAPEIKRASIKRRTLEKRRDKLEKEAAATDDPIQRELLLRDIEKLEEEIPGEINPPRLWTGDTTPERLQSLLADHGERIAVLTDEGGIFEVMAGLYSDGRANLDIFLQGHAGKSVRVDRQGRAAHLDAPALTFGLAIQPAILAEMGTGGKRRFRGNGILARFLFAVPRSNIGKRDVRDNNPIPPSIEAAYKNGIFNLLAIPPQVKDNREMPRQLALNPEALDSWQAFSQMIEERQGEGGDLEGIQDWSGKLPGAALRIAGNFHLVEYGPTPPPSINVATIERALDLCELLIEHAKAAFAMMDADPATADAKAVSMWIKDSRLTSFKRGEAYRQFKGRFTGKPERLDRALKELVNRFIITAAGKELTQGRPATVYNVNPLIVGAE